MRQKIVYLMVIAALVLGLIGLQPAPMAEAGSNGQQVMFQKASGTRAQGITWIRVYGKNQHGHSVSWYREFNPLVNEYRLNEASSFADNT